jgi:HSP20 family protein
MLLNLLEKSGGFGNVWKEFDKAHKELFFSGGLVRSEFHPSINISQNENEALLESILNGFDPEKIDIQVSENSVEISGKIETEDELKRENLIREEIFQNSFKRRIEFGFQIEKGKVEANFKNGILTLKLPKSEISKPKKINVEVSN